MKRRKMWQSSICASIRTVEINVAVIGASTSPRRIILTSNAMNDYTDRLVLCFGQFSAPHSHN